jgi:DNA-binding XRE family transcriptional regulator
MLSAGAELRKALEEVRDVLDAGEPLDRRFAVRSYRLDFAGRNYGPDDVRSVRQFLGLSQPLFANFLGVDASTVRSWEQGARPPSTIARRFIASADGPGRSRLDIGTVSALEYLIKITRSAAGAKQPRL